MEKICGRCSQDKGMTLEERTALALSRVPKQIYNCPVCKTDHFFDGKIQKPRPEIEVPKETPKKVAKHNKKEVFEEQLVLF